MMSSEVENIPKCCVWGAGGAVITKCEAWPNDGILTWGYCLKMENASSSDFITGTVRDFVVLER